jgi:hypothetical protein
MIAFNRSVRYTTTPEALQAGATSIEVRNCSMFKAGDVIVVGYTDNETNVVSGPCQSTSPNVFVSNASNTSRRLSQGSATSGYIPLRTPLLKNHDKGSIVRRATPHQTNSDTPPVTTTPQVGVATTTPEVGIATTTPQVGVATTTPAIASKFITDLGKLRATLPASSVFTMLGGALGAGFVGGFVVRGLFRRRETLVQYADVDSQGRDSEMASVPDSRMLRRLTSNDEAGSYQSMLTRHSSDDQDTTNQESKGLTSL